MLFHILTIFISQLLSTQGAYDLHLEDFVVAAYSKEYISEPDSYVDDSNAIVIHFSIIKQFPRGTQGRLSMMGASMGEFVVDTGIDMTMDFCDLINEPIVMTPLFQALGIDPNECPPNIGVYGTEGYKIQMSKLPDEYPPNNYRDAIEIFYEEQELLTLHLFSKVV